MAYIRISEVKTSFNAAFPKFALSISLGSGTVQGPASLLSLYRTHRSNSKAKMALFRISSTPVLVPLSFSPKPTVFSTAASAPFYSPNFKNSVTHTQIKFAGTTSVYPIFQVPLAQWANQLSIKEKQKTLQFLHMQFASLLFVAIEDNSRLHIHMARTTQLPCKTSSSPTWQYSCPTSIISAWQLSLRLTRITWLSPWP